MGTRDEVVNNDYDSCYDSTGPYSPTPVRANNLNTPIAPSSAPCTSASSNQNNNNNSNNKQSQHANTNANNNNQKTRGYPSPSNSPQKRSKVVYGDRYIPSRNGNLQAAFSLAHDQVSKPKPRRPQSSDLDYQRVEEANKTFSTLLKAELFGNEVPSAAVNASSINKHNNVNSNGNSTKSGSQGSSTTSDQSTSRNTPPPPPYRTTRSAPVTPNKNIFRYQTQSRSVVREACFDDSSSSITRSSQPRSDIAHASHDIYSLSPVRMDSQRLLLSPKKQLRSIARVPYKVLDAPDLADDFYLNLVDWGAKNLLGVALGRSVYLWHATTASVNKLCDVDEGDRVTSINWIKQGTHLAIGTNSGLVQIWDVEEHKKVRTMTGHLQRVGSLAWNEHLLSSGSRDRTILHRDVRVADHYIEKLTGHRQEVCGLRWNPEENQLASGSNDNRLFVWDGMSKMPTYKFEHVAAVKAIAWSPHQRGILASGGGTADRRIRFWNTITGQHLSDIDTGSQVCNLAWSKNSNELVSTHGYSQNQVMVWKYPTMQQVAALTGHTYRVLYLAVSPDGRTVVTGAGDETLRFWNVFDSQKSQNRMSNSLLDVYQQLR